MQYPIKRGALYSTHDIKNTERLSMTSQLERKGVYPGSAKTYI